MQQRFAQLAESPDQVFPTLCNTPADLSSRIGCWEAEVRLFASQVANTSLGGFSVFQYLVFLGDALVDAVKGFECNG